VEYTDEFGEWWDSLTDKEQGALDAVVKLLERDGPNLRFPYSSGVRSSRHSGMRELRTQAQGRPLRAFYVFDQRRAAVLLIGGNKTGNDRFYEELTPVADRIYDRYLEETGE
jgi:hypothetical protein